MSTKIQDQDSSSSSVYSVNAKKKSTLQVLKERKEDQAVSPKGGRVPKAAKQAGQLMDLQYTDKKDEIVQEILKVINKYEKGKVENLAKSLKANVDGLLAQISSDTQTNSVASTLIKQRIDEAEKQANGASTNIQGSTDSGIHNFFMILFSFLEKNVGANNEQMMGTFNHMQAQEKNFSNTEQTLEVVQKDTQQKISDSKHGLGMILGIVMGILALVVTVVTAGAGAAAFGGAAAVAAGAEAGTAASAAGTAAATAGGVTGAAASAVGSVAGAAASSAASAAITAGASAAEAATIGAAAGEAATVAAIDSVVGISTTAADIGTVAGEAAGTAAETAGLSTEAVASITEATTEATTTACNNVITDLGITGANTAADTATDAAEQGLSKGLRFVKSIFGNTGKSAFLKWLGFAGPIGGVMGVSYMGINQNAMQQMSNALTQQTTTGTIYSNVSNQTQIELQKDTQQGITNPTSTNQNDATVANQAVTLMGQVDSISSRA